MKCKTTSFFCLISIIAISQILNASESINVEGIILDAETGLPLPYANIQILNTNRGTMSNVDGKFSISFTMEYSKLKIAYIGYEPKSISIQRSTKYLQIELAPTTLKGENVVVYSNALTWIEKYVLNAIDRKKQYRNELRYYQALAYSKSSFIFVKSKMIFALIEAISNISYKAPDIYEEHVLNLKMPPHMKNMPYQVLAINQNIDLYNERIKINKFSIVSPLNYNALEYYQYTVSDQFLSGQDTLMRVTVTPKKTRTPLFSGDLIFVKDSYKLLEAQLTGNNAVKDGLADSLSLLVKYRNDSTLMLPIFTMFTLRMNYFGIPYLFTQENCMTNYSVNNPQDKPYINLDRLVSNESNPDYNIDLQRDNVFKMPLSEKEEQHEDTIDRIFIHAPFRRRLYLFLFNLLPLMYDQPGTIGNFKINRFSDWYRFNKVDGNFIGAEYQMLNNDVGLISTQGGYSFGQRSFNYTIRSRYKNVEFQTQDHIINLGGFDYNKTSITLSGLISHQDEVHYYQSKNYVFAGSFDIGSRLNVKLNMNLERQSPVENSTNFSLLNRNRTFSTNYIIQPYDNNSMGIEFNYLENRDMVNNRPIIYYSDPFLNMSVGYYRQDKSILNATENRSIFHLNIHRFQPIWHPLALDLKLIYHKQDRSDFIQTAGFISKKNGIFERENDLCFFTLKDYKYYVNDYLKLHGDITLFELPAIYTIRMSVGGILSYLKPLDSFDYSSIWFNKLDREFFEYGMSIKGISIYNLYIATNTMSNKNLYFMLMMNF